MTLRPFSGAPHRWQAYSGLSFKGVDSEATNDERVRQGPPLAGSCWLKPRAAPPLIASSPQNNCKVEEEDRP